MELPRALCALLALLFLVACASESGAPTMAPSIPTPAALPTSTPAPTATSLPLPTPTPVPATPLDGSRIALVTRTYSGGENFGSNVILLNESQGAVQETLIVDAESPSWSSDSRQLLISKVGAITLVDTSTMQARTMSFPPQGESDHLPQWSPDGRWISFVRAAGTKTSSYVYPGLWQELSLWTMQTDGSHARRMASTWQPNGSIWTPSWSPDSTTLAYPSNRSNETLEWRFVEAVSGQLIPMTLAADVSLWPEAQLAGWQIVWAPRSAAGVIVFDWENGRCAYAVSLSLFDAHLGRITRVLSVPWWARLLWTADGSELRFDAPANYEQRPGACNSITPEAPRTFAVPRNGGPIRSLPLDGTATPTMGGAPNVRIDARGVRFLAPDGSERSLMQFTPDLNLLHAHCRYCEPAIAPSAHGSRIFFVVGRLSAPQFVRGAVWSIDVTTGDLERLTADQNIVEFVATP